MKNWNDYKEHVNAIDTNSSRDIVDMEEQAKIIKSVSAQHDPAIFRKQVWYKGKQM